MNNTGYLHESPKDFTKGQRVELHPGTDQWMMGDRFGTVSRIERHWVRVRMDKSKRSLRVPASQLAILA